MKRAAALSLSVAAVMAGPGASWAAGRTGDFAVEAVAVKEGVRDRLDSTKGKLLSPRTMTLRKVTEARIREVGCGKDSCRVYYAAGEGSQAVTMGSAHASRALGLRAISLSPNGPYKTTLYLEGADELRAFEDPKGAVLAARKSGGIVKLRKVGFARVQQVSCVLSECAVSFEARYERGVVKTGRRLGQEATVFAFSEPNVTTTLYVTEADRLEGVEDYLGRVVLEKQ